MRATEGFYPQDSLCGYAYKPLLPVSFAALDYLNWDTDGDGVWDGDDDQDHDDVSNVDEILPPYGPPCPETGPRSPINGTPDGAERLRDPFNPCLPYRSRTCARYGGA